VRQGKVFIAQPPLYQISRGKQVTYVLNDKRMNETLVDLALGHASFAVRDEKGAVRHSIAGDEIRRMVRALDRLDELVTVSQRRGIAFAKLIAMRAQDPTGKGRLPSWHLAWPEGDLLFFGEAEARAALATQDLVLDDLVTAEMKVDRRRIASLRELHENREIERIVGQLAQWHIDIADWDRVQVETVTGDKEPTRYAWIVENTKGAKASASGSASASSSSSSSSSSSNAAADGGEDDGRSDGDKAAARDAGVVEAANVPGIVRALLEVGRRGIEVKRFKGLGEMEAEQLWETTMDQSRRTLVRVTIESASEADTLFTLLMGEDVERRRAYIEKHALEVKNLDI
jgi:DNA gyrase subunit B